MAAGTIISVGRLAADATGACNDGTSAYFGCNNGELWKGTLGSSAVARQVLMSSGIGACETDNTNVFLGLKNGEVRYSKIPWNGKRTRINRVSNFFLLKILQSKGASLTREMFRHDSFTITGKLFWEIKHLLDRRGVAYGQ
jgi:hypothetical protein